MAQIASQDELTFEERAVVRWFIDHEPEKAQKLLLGHFDSVKLPYFGRSGVLMEVRCKPWMVEFEVADMQRNNTTVR